MLKLKRQSQPGATGNGKGPALNFKWTVGAKIAAGFALGIFALIIISAIAYGNTTDLNNVTHLRDESRVRQNDLGELLIQINSAEASVYSFLLTEQEGDLNTYRAVVTSLPAQLDTLKAEGADLPGWGQDMTELSRLIDARLEAMQTLIDLRRSSGLAASGAMLKVTGGHAAVADVRGKVSDLQADEIKRVRDFSDKADSASALAVTGIVIRPVIAILLLVIAGFVITRSISRALRELTGAAERIARGDLSVNMVEDERSDEVGVLKNAFARMNTSLRQKAAVAEQIAAGNLQVDVVPLSENDMLGNAFAAMVVKLRTIMNDLREAATTLAASTTEILATTNQIAASAAQTASAVAQTTATVEQVKQTAHLSSEKAREVSDGALRSSEVSEVGTQAVEDTTHGMDKIRDQMDLVAASIVRLSEQRQAIGEIIATVNDLAEQSNLLAVNAAIEAAKAGEHGRGFAVVAQEVRRLAEQSKAATAQVRSILSDIEKATTSAVMATEQGAKAVESGTRQSINAGDAIRELADNISESTRAATQIAASSQQQLIGMDQIAEAMESINQASLQNVASTRQASVSAQNLNSLGQKLKLVVAQYRV